MTMVAKDLDPLDIMFELRLEDDRLWGEVACDQQIDDVEAIFRSEDANKHFLTRPRGGSKPLALDTEIPTPTGWTTMGELRVGDLVLDDKGHPTRVHLVGPIKFGEPCYRVEFAAGESITASGDHEWIVEDRQIKVNRGRDYTVTVTTEEMLKRLHYGARGDLRWGAPVGGAFDLPEVSLPLDPYVLGAWLGDGHSETAKITVADSDRDELAAIFENAGQPFGASTRKDAAHCGTWRFGIPYGRRINDHGPIGYESTDVLRSLDVIGNKHIPPAYLRSSAKQRLELLRGLMDSDGHQSHSLSYFNTTSEQLRDGVAELVVSLGWKAWRQESRAMLNSKDCGPSYRIGFRSDECPFHLTRKAARWSAPGAQAHRSENRTITAVVRVPSVPVRCIGVEAESHLYLAGRDAIPTHNTTDIAGLIVAWLRAGARSRARAYCVAANSDQAAEIIDAAAGFIERTPQLDGVLHSENERIINDENGAWVRVLPASESGAWGKRDCHFLICDEFCQWPETRGAKRVWTAVRTTVQKTPGCQLVILSSSGAPSHWSRAIFLNAATGRDRWRVSVMPGPVPWQDPAEIESLRNDLTPAEFDRLINNIWAEDEDRGVSEEDWNDAKVTCQSGGTKSRRWFRHLDAKTGIRYIVTVDIGLVKDATVIVVSHLEPLDTEDRTGPKRIVVDHLERWEGSKAHPVQLQGKGGVEERVMQLAREYNRARIFADPSQFVGSLQNMNRGGLHAKEWKFTGSSVGELASALVQVFRNRLIHVPNATMLRDELLRVRLVESNAGQPRLDHDASGHDDMAVTIGMACHILIGRAGGGTAAFREMMERERDKRESAGENPDTGDPSQLQGGRAALRHLQSVQRRQERAASAEASAQRRCQHRWRATRDGGAYCVFGCGATKAAG